VSTSGIEDEGWEEMYGITEEILDRDGKGETTTAIMGEWNSLVGDKSYRKTAGPHGLKKIQYSGQTFVDICERNRLDIANTWLKKPKRRFYTCSHQETDVDSSCTTCL
jgi:hypothetical protein